MPFRTLFLALVALCCLALPAWSQRGASSTGGPVEEAPPPASAQRSDRDPRQAIPREMTLQEKAWNRGDLAGFMRGYLASDELTYTAGGITVRGWKALMARYQARYGDSPATMGRLRFENLEIVPLGPDYALSVGQWFLESSAPEARADAAAAPPRAARAAGVLDGVFSLVWRRTHEGWRIIHDHSSLRTSK